MSKAFGDNDATWDGKMVLANALGTATGQSFVKSELRAKKVDEKTAQHIPKTVSDLGQEYVSEYLAVRKDGLSQGDAERTVLQSAENDREFAGVNLEGGLDERRWASSGGDSYDDLVSVYEPVESISEEEYKPFFNHEYFDKLYEIDPNYGKNKLAEALGDAEWVLNLDLSELDFDDSMFEAADLNLITSIGSESTPVTEPAVETNTQGRVADNSLIIGSWHPDNYLDVVTSGAVTPAPTRTLTAEEAASQEFWSYKNDLDIVGRSFAFTGLGLTYLGSKFNDGWGSHFEVAKTPIDSIRRDLRIEKYANTLDIDSRMFTPIVDEVGVGLTKFSAYFSVFSYGSAYYDANVQEGGVAWEKADWFRETGKLTTDSVFAASAFLRNSSYLARLNPLGVAYTVVDLTVQLTPSYTIQYGKYAGETRDGFTKLMYANADWQYKVEQVSPEVYEDMYMMGPKF